MYLSGDFGKRQIAWITAFDIQVLREHEPFGFEKFSVTSCHLILEILSGKFLREKFKI